MLDEKKGDHHNGSDYTNVWTEFEGLGCKHSLIDEYEASRPG